MVTKTQEKLDVIPCGYAVYWKPFKKSYIQFPIHASFEEAKADIAMFGDPKHQTYVGNVYDQSAIDLLQTRILALEKDAARYRWLRNTGDENFPSYSSRVNPQVADDYIDTAITRKLDTP